MPPRSSTVAHRPTRKPSNAKADAPESDEAPLSSRKKSSASSSSTPTLVNNGGADAVANASSRIEALEAQLKSLSEHRAVQQGIASAERNLEDPLFLKYAELRQQVELLRHKLEDASGTLKDTLMPPLSDEIKRQLGVFLDTHLPTLVKSTGAAVIHEELKALDVPKMIDRTIENRLEGALQDTVVEHVKPQIKKLQQAVQGQQGAVEELQMKVQGMHGKQKALMRECEGIKGLLEAQTGALALLRVGGGGNGGSNARQEEEEELDEENTDDEEGEEDDSTELKDPSYSPKNKTTKRHPDISNATGLVFPPKRGNLLPPIPTMVVASSASAASSRAPPPPPPAKKLPSFSEILAAAGSPSKQSKKLPKKAAPAASFTVSFNTSSSSSSSSSSSPAPIVPQAPANPSHPQEPGIYHFSAHVPKARSNGDTTLKLLQFQAVERLFIDSPEMHRQWVPRTTVLQHLGHLRDPRKPEKPLVNPQFWAHMLQHNEATMRPRDEEDLDAHQQPGLVSKLAKDGRTWEVRYNPGDGQQVEEAEEEQGSMDVTPEKKEGAGEPTTPPPAPQRKKRKLMFLGLGGSKRIMGPRSPGEVEDTAGGAATDDEDNTGVQITPTQVQSLEGEFEEAARSSGDALRVVATKGGD